jgi:hypothetical protein
MPTTKKLDPDLDAFLYSVTCLSIKDFNKHFIFNLSDTNRPVHVWLIEIEIG